MTDRDAAPPTIPNHDRQSLIAQIIVLHVWRHPEYVPACAVCQSIKDGRWPR